MTTTHESEVSTTPPDADARFRGYLATLDASELRELALELAAFSRQGFEHLSLRATAASDDARRLSTSLTEAVRGALSIRGRTDAWRIQDACGDLEPVLQEIERQLDAGHADAVRPVLQRALDRLITLSQRATAGIGLLGRVCQRAADLHVRACQQGRPSGTSLARWLVRFRVRLRDYPNVSLADYRATLGQRGLTAYRQAVETLDESPSEPDDWARYHRSRMLLELADIDGDSDRAIEVLADLADPHYGAIVHRLRAAGRTEEVLLWLDRAVAAGCIDASGVSVPAASWAVLVPADVAADSYLAAGREGDAVRALRVGFLRCPGAHSFLLLMGYATRIGGADEVRRVILEHERAIACDSDGDGALLVEIALAENDLDAAFEAASVYGAGDQWRDLVGASADIRPLDAAQLYEPHLPGALANALSGNYEGLVILLTELQHLYWLAEADLEFTARMWRLRDHSSRQPQGRWLAHALDAAGLP